MNRTSTRSRVSNQDDVRGIAAGFVVLIAVLMSTARPVYASIAGPCDVYPCQEWCDPDCNPLCGNDHEGQPRGPCNEHCLEASCATCPGGDPTEACHNSCCPCTPDCTGWPPVDISVQPDLTWAGGIIEVTVCASPFAPDGWYSVHAMVGDGFFTSEQTHDCPLYYESPPPYPPLPDCEEEIYCLDDEGGYIELHPAFGGDQVTLWLATDYIHAPSPCFSGIGTPEHNSVSVWDSWGSVLSAREFLAIGLDLCIAGLHQPSSPGHYLGVNDNFNEGKAVSGQPREDRESVDLWNAQSIPVTDDLVPLDLGIFGDDFVSSYDEWPVELCGNFDDRVAVYLTPMLPDPNNPDISEPQDPENPTIRIHAIKWVEGSPGYYLWYPVSPIDSVLWAIRSGYDLYVEGCQPGELHIEAMGWIDNDDSRKRKADAYLTVVQIDADVDSDNTNTTAPYGPDAPPATPPAANVEDRIEQRAGEPGRFVLVNDDDDDRDGILDLDDGYNKNGDTDPENMDADDRTYLDAAHKEDDFVMLKVKIAPSDIDLDPNKAWVRVGHYPYLSPDPDVTNGSGSTGRIRIWKKPGDEARDRRNARPDNNGPGEGDWVAPGEYKDLRQLMPGNVTAAHEMTFYVEGVQVSQAAGDVDITFEIDPDGEGTAAGYVHMDTVQVTVIKLDLDVDTDRSIQITDADDAHEELWTIDRGAIVLYNCDDDNQDSGTGTITAGSVSDANKSWYSDQWEGSSLVITSGDNEGWRTLVSANEKTSLTLSPVWKPSSPVAGVAAYKVFDGRDAHTDGVDGPFDYLDMAPVQLRLLGSRRLPAGWSVALSVVSNADRMRLWGNEDLDGDHHLDCDEDSNFNGVLDPGEDADGDGRLDVAEDVNENGVLDTNEDLDGDGHFDVDEDTNGNGILDPDENLDRDGWLDRREDDLNGDGRLTYIGLPVAGLGASPTPDVTRWAQQGITMYLEALSFPEPGFLPPELVIRAELRYPGGQVFAVDEVRLRVAPWLMIPATQSAQKILVVKTTDFNPNAPFVASIQALCGTGNVMVIPGAAYGQDRWIQDQIEIGYTDAPYGAIHVVLNSARGHLDSGRMSSFAEHQLLGPDMGLMYCPGAAPDSTVGFGNLEVSPPVTVAGRRYHLGRIVHGQIADSDMANWLEAQEIQEQFEVDLAFLATKHIDELFSFMSASEQSTQQGFRVVVASPQRARVIMQNLVNNGCGDSPLAVPPNSLPLFSVQSLLSNATLRANWEPQNSGASVSIGAACATLQTELDLNPATDFLEVPVWFADRRTGEGLVAYSANVANGLWLDACQFIIPNTFGPEGPLGMDEFLSDINLNFTAVGCLLQPVDDWLWYHEDDGEVHCGTNAIRAVPPQPWWSPD